MTRTQAKASKIAVAVLTAAAISLLSWGAHRYDASKLDTSTFEKYVVRDSARHAYDSLASSYQYQQIRAAQERTDSTVRKICAVVVGGRC